MVGSRAFSELRLIRPQLISSKETRPHCGRAVLQGATSRARQIPCSDPLEVGHCRASGLGTAGGEKSSSVAHL